VSKTILLVEDSNTQALHVQALLEQEGLQVTWAKDGLEGLRLAQQQPPDLVILDVQLPGMNGFQLCQRLAGSSATADIPIILFTSYNDPKAALFGMQMGAVEYIPKDASANVVLLETIRQMGLIE
jgi:CheY-like chemotaxis protein